MNCDKCGRETRKAIPVYIGEEKVGQYCEDCGDKLEREFELSIGA